VLVCQGKSFRYLTTPLSPRVRHIKDSSLLHSQTFHILARPDDLLVHISELSLHRVQSHNDGRLMVIWEPLPSDCKPVHLDAHLQALQQVDVFSPNHLELMSLFEGAEDLSRPFDRLLIENYAKRCLDAKAPGSANAGFGVIVRAGEHGCLIQSALQGCRWLPAYYGEHSTRVVDPTGAGNTFLGAFGNMFAKTGDLHEAAIFGTVAASFALEQFGLPNFNVVDGRDTWNGDTFGERLGRYRP
jgi:sugar/nucleoside kinase (ribokinase family)